MNYLHNANNYYSPFWEKLAAILFSRHFHFPAILIVNGYIQILSRARVGCRSRRPKKNMELVLWKLY